MTPSSPIAGMLLHSAKLTSPGDFSRFNSTIFLTTASNQYFVYGVSESMLATDSADVEAGNKTRIIFNNGLSMMMSSDEAKIRKSASTQLSDLLRLASTDNLIRLENDECIAAYARIPQTDTSNLLVVSSSEVSSDYTSCNWVGGFDSGYNTDPYKWICDNTGRNIGASQYCSDVVGKIRANASGWAPFGDPSKYCLAQRTEQACAVNFSTELAGIFIAFGALKLIIIAVVAFKLRHAPLLTLGDAVASFLRQPDVHTEDMCLAEISSFRSVFMIRRWPTGVATPWRRKLRFRLFSPGWFQWVSCLLP